ncbi:hypothetical protein C7271_09030 [filamentous cyanobacterium CCP5]|nr:hypothetical protein C7271_09030 [filamentous cyanobacterium CCP5]
MGLSLAAIAVILGGISAAQADTVIRTSQAQIRLSDNGGIQIYTDRDGGYRQNSIRGFTPTDSYRSTSSATVNRLLNCNYQSQRNQAYHSTTPNGDRVIARSQSQTTLCQ